MSSAITSNRAALLNSTLAKGISSSSGLYGMMATAQALDAINKSSQANMAIKAEQEQINQQFKGMMSQQTENIFMPNIQMYDAEPIYGDASAAATGGLISGLVQIGGALGAALPTDFINIVGALSFIGFGLWTLRGDELTEKDKESTKLSSKHVIMAVGTVFFLAEMGDKTMLATVTLATSEGLVGTWAGSTAGMVVADALAIVVGKALGDRLPEKAIRIGSSIAFFVFAALMLADALR